MKLHSILGIILLKAIICQGQNNGDLLIWSPKKLSWNDFKQEYNEVNNLGHSSKIRWEFHFKLVDTQDSLGSKKVAEIWAGFNPQLSWVRPDVKDNYYLLNHEQLHFDIVELYARKLRKLLLGNDLSGRKDRKAAMKLKRQIYSDLLKLQRLYDEETKHSLNRVRQSWWDNNVANQLKELSGFS